MIEQAPDNPPTPKQAPQPTSSPAPNQADPSPASPQAYKVRLDAYSGPLDLLLYLVRRNEIDLYDIPVSELTEQYLDHIKVIQTFDVDRAGEFLVMAATLLEIKSQLLVPRIDEAIRERSGEEELTEEEQNRLDESDPRYELVQQLLAYKRFKDASIELEHREYEWQNRFQSAPKKAMEDPDAQPEEPEIDLADINVLDLCRAFGRLLDSIGRKNFHEVTYDDTPISVHADDIYDLLASDGPMSLQQIFTGRTNRSEMIGLFLATLELARNNRVTIRQNAAKDDIELVPIPVEDQNKSLEDIDASEKWKNPETGELEYGWPDLLGFQHHMRREKMRRTAEAKQKAEETGEKFNAAAWKRDLRQWEREQYLRYGFPPPVYKESKRANPFAAKNAQTTGHNPAADPNGDATQDDESPEDDHETEGGWLSEDEEEFLPEDQDAQLDEIERKLQAHRQRNDEQDAADKSKQQLDNNEEQQ
ncbi:Segregation and condensation protein A [Poriferisphaera corsica]|uniref:Segregation and condensation protein A n=1 Tax=Poriferisphaera corsica TaxID=2528020 RepID=A0A517YR85_9BACT|nr:segregation/condensation protein A [Poriferisphaera corsica]QDU32736.1 Segregation and condensation protein A [Poriferisphaera corsica]